MNPFFETVLKVQEETAAVSQNDYVNENDGLIYCGKCHTPKQKRLPDELYQRLVGKLKDPNIPQIHFCSCKCITEEEERLARGIQGAGIESKRHACFPDGKYCSQCFEADNGMSDREAMKKALIYTQHLHEMYRLNTGLIIYGDVGRGKSYLMACIANRAIDMGYYCYMTDFSRIIDGEWGVKSKEEYYSQFDGYDFLFIDDFGRERKTETANEIVVKVIERRINSGKPLIMTTNISPISMMQAGQSNQLTLEQRRIYSRVLSIGRTIQVNGTDLRQQLSANRNRSAAEILGF